jgi:hypothetical protein
MTADTTATDVGFGLAIAFGALAILAALGSTATSYRYAIDGSSFMQLLSGVTVGLAVLFGALAIAALHLYGE